VLKNIEKDEYICMELDNMYTTKYLHVKVKSFNEIVVKKSNFQTALLLGIYPSDGVTIRYPSTII
jgi:hypothetical protein